MTMDAARSLAVQLVLSPTHRVGERCGFRIFPGPASSCFKMMMSPVCDTSACQDALDHPASDAAARRGAPHMTRQPCHRRSHRSQHVSPPRYRGGIEPPKRRSGDQRPSHVCHHGLSRPKAWPKISARVCKTWLILPVVICLSQSRS